MPEVPLLITEAAAKNPRYRAPRYKISLVKDGGSVYATAKPLTNMRLVYDLAQELFEEIDREAFYVFCLDGKLKVIGVNLVSLGTLDAAIVHPREVFKAAILLNASSIICAHNHPSGNPQPSGQDAQLTSRLVAAGTILGIPLNDHVICGEDSYFSFNERGMIATYEQLTKRMKNPTDEDDYPEVVDVADLAPEQFSFGAKTTNRELYSLASEMRRDAGAVGVTFEGDLLDRLKEIRDSYRR